MRVDIINTTQLEDLIEIFGYDQGFVIPTVDQIIDYLRIKYNVIIYNDHVPYVSPITHKIMYSYAVKWCNLRDGWNGRESIGKSDCTHDIYEAKRQAITIALNYLKNKNKK